jgi:poly(beta-D-mannuronate) lyase
MDAYRDGVRQITPEGTLPLEMNRAARALHYHLYALAPLVMIAEFGEANGLDLYSERGFAIKRLVARCIAGLQDHSYFAQHTGQQQDMPDTITGFEIGWAVPYARRFPDPQISSLLAQAKSTGYTTWGGVPPE